MKKILLAFVLVVGLASMVHDGRTGEKTGRRIVRTTIVQYRSYCSHAEKYGAAGQQAQRALPIRRRLPMPPGQPAGGAAFSAGRFLDSVWVRY